VAVSTDDAAVGIVTYQRMGRLEEAIDVLEAGQGFFYRSEARSRNARIMRSERNLDWLILLRTT
jgi:hypothetical protein